MIVGTEQIVPSIVVHTMSFCAIFKVLACSLLFAVAAAVLAGEPTNTFTGYTRPGWPNDKGSGDNIIFAADNAEVRDLAIGGTVYFTVLQLSGKAGDSWGTGLAKFNGAFKTGIDSNGTASPMLDTTAKYLYLYQVVNDRKTPAPIMNVSVKLIVDPSAITSWGFFHGAGFALAVKGDKDQAAEQIRPVSFNNVVAASLLDKMYKSPTEAHSTSKSLQVVWVPTKLGEEAPKAADDQRVLKVVWDALDPALDPNHVMMLPRSDFNEKPCIRAVWNPDNPIKKDVRTTIFGFTSNRPPTYELVRLRGLRKVKQGGEIKPAVDVGGKVEEMGLFRDDVQAGVIPAGLVGAEGKVPTPRPENLLPEQDVGPGFSPGLGSFPPMAPPVVAAAPGGAVGGGGGGGGSGGGGFVPPPPFTGGGGGGIASSTPNQNQNQNSTGQQVSNQTQTINFSPLSTNQQAQGQLQALFQAQLQLQLQLQSQAPDPHAGLHVLSEVVPQPAAWLLAVLGLPMLLFAARRARMQPV